MRLSGSDDSTWRKEATIPSNNPRCFNRSDSLGSLRCSYNTGFFRYLTPIIHNENCCGQVVNVVDEMICVLFSPICGQEPDLSQLTLNRTINTANGAKHLLKLLLVLSKIEDGVAMLWL